ncbi:hypothetical protein KDL01_27800 [Actinospica durhamensis]|uniref:DUF2567 domain-containing protein n=1 Tax=Actinospica durhamensis TaxID=1508375 RepID=A0A941ETT8_9ACTN|nr:hypothetical protein [Actinospica durhamensis]MBR7837113.1 hypothetical protein [Actinospica durhamensis]
MSIEISAPPPQRTRAREAWAPEAVGALVIGALSLVAGVIVGVAWRYLAPPVHGVITVSGGQKAAYYENPETKGFVGQDGMFAVCGVVAAVLLALAAFFWFRRRAPIGVALALGGAGIGASYLAAWFGVWLGPGRGSVIASTNGVAANQVFDLPLNIGATGVIWLWPAVAVGLYFLLMLVFGPSDDPEQTAAQYEFPQWADPVDLTAPGPQDTRPEQHP